HNQIEDTPILELNIILDVLKGSHVNLRPFISVISFRIVHRLTSIVNRLEVFLMALPQDCTYGEIACITHKLEWQVQFRAIKIGASKMSHRPRDFGEILNESPVKTDVTEETSNTLDGCGMRQFSDDIDFGSVNLNPVF
nr:hypothetical protein [Tanacetum cinerariifolium]